MGNTTHIRSLIRYCALAGLLTALLLLHAGTARAAAPPKAGITLLQSGAGGVVIEFRPVALPAETVMIDGSPYLRCRVEGGAESGSLAPGGPSLPSVPVTLRLLSAKNNSVEVLSSEYEDIPQTLIAPVPRWQDGELDPLPLYAVDQTLYASQELYPPSPAALTDVGATQGAVLATLRLQPYQYNAALRTLRRYTRLVVRVNFAPAAGRALAPSPLVRGIALNDAAVPAGGSRAGLLPLKNSVLSSGLWYRFPVTEEGIYRLTGQDLLAAGIPPSADPATIRIYGNGGFETPMSATSPAVDDLLENAVAVNDGGTAGQLDPGDEIFFYCKSTRGWNYDTGTKTFSHYINRFSDVNYYWLTYGGAPGRRMTQVDGTPGLGMFQPQTVAGTIFREDDKVNLISSGIEWLGQPFNGGDQITYIHQLFALDATQPVRYRFRVGARSSGFSTFAIDEHGQRLNTVGLPGTDLGTYSYKLSAATVTSQQVPAFTDGRSQLKFTFTSASASANGYIDWYEIVYAKFLRAQANQCEFHSYDTSAAARYDVSGFTGGGVMVFDVSRFDSVVQIVNPRLSGDTCSFTLGPGAVRDLYVVGSGGYKSPPNLTRVENQNLHGDTAQPAFVIITHPEFMPAAQRLQHYREQPGNNALSTSVVDVTRIYNEFGGGMPCPAAIRNYLRYLYNHAQTPPRYALLLGDGSYDYKNITTTMTNWIPAWETEESFDPLSSYAVDDDYVIFDAGNRVSMALGRLTPQSLAEADGMVDKIIEYETHPVVDPWKVRLTYVADDGPQAPGVNDLLLHTRDAENLSQIPPPLFERRKIYLYDYPTVYTSAGRRKPDVNTAIVNQMNQGTLVVNFSGHGNPRVWTHEQVFVRETDFAKLANRGKYFFLVAATCNYSHFDMVNDQSGSELLLGMPGAGAIAVFSATGPVYQGANFLLNSALDRLLFQTDVSGNVVPSRLGDDIYAVKQTNYQENDRKYLLLGDPTMRLDIPEKFGSIDSINGVPTAQTVQLQALNTAAVKATVHDSTLSDISPFSGSSQLTVYDANRLVLIQDSVLLSNNTWHKDALSYAATGNTLFRGEQSVAAGLMSANFVVPKDITYGNDFGRMTLYFWNAAGDGAGATTSFRVGGTDTTAAADQQGPAIRLFIDGRGFRSGDVVSATPVLLADLFDSSGINTSGAGVGHRLEAWLDDQAQSIDLSDYYKGKTDTYREGTVQYPLGALPQGTHKIRLRAWDTYNNSSSEETVFDVLTSAGLRLTNVYNIPNPVQSSTVFTFEHNQLATLDVEVKIYTVAGRMIQSLKKTGVSGSFVEIPWDGRDKDGDLPANGVYLYKIIAKTEDNRFTNEALGKLSILR